MEKAKGKDGKTAEKPAKDTDYDLETIENMVSSSELQVQNIPDAIKAMETELAHMKETWKIMSAGGFKVLRPKFSYEATPEWEAHVTKQAKDKYKLGRKGLEEGIKTQTEQLEKLTKQYEHWKRVLKKKKKLLAQKPDYVG